MWVEMKSGGFFTFPTLVNDDDICVSPTNKGDSSATSDTLTVG